MYKFGASAIQFSKFGNAKTSSTRAKRERRGKYGGHTFRYGLNLKIMEGEKQQFYEGGENFGDKQKELSLQEADKFWKQLESSNVSLADIQKLVQVMIDKFPNLSESFENFQNRVSNELTDKLRGGKEEEGKKETIKDNDNQKERELEVQQIQNLVKRTQELSWEYVVSFRTKDRNLQDKNLEESRKVWNELRKYKEQIEKQGGKLDLDAIYEANNKVMGEASKYLDEYTKTHQVNEAWYMKILKSLPKTLEASLDITAGNILTYTSAPFTGFGEKNLGTKFVEGNQYLMNKSGVGSVLGTPEELADTSLITAYSKINPLGQAGGAVSGAMEGVDAGYDSYKKAVLGEGYDEYQNSSLGKVGDLAFDVSKLSAGTALAISTGGSYTGLTGKELLKTQAATGGKMLLTSTGISGTTALGQELYQMGDGKDFDIGNLTNNTFKGMSDSALFMGGVAYLNKVLSGASKLESQIARLQNHTNRTAVLSETELVKLTDEIQTIQLVLKNSVQTANIVSKSIDIAEGSADFPETIEMIEKSKNWLQTIGASTILASNIADTADVSVSGILNGAKQTQKLAAELLTKMPKEVGEFVEKAESLEKELLAQSQNTKETDILQKFQTINFENMSVEDIAKLGDDNRVLAGEFFLKRELTQQQREAIIKAHYTGIPNNTGKYSFGDLKEKYIILHREGKFSDNEIKTLMENRVCGKIPETINTLYSNLRYKFLEEYKDILGEDLKLSDIVGEGENGIILKHPTNENVIIKIAKPGNTDNLTKELQNHKKFHEEWKKGIKNGEIDSRIRVPEIFENGDGYFVIEKIEGHSLYGETLVKHYEDKLSPEDIQKAKSMSDTEIRNILKTKGISDWSMNTIIEDWSAENLIELLGGRARKETPLSKALDYLWNAGVYHADKHPGNFMIDKNGNIYIIDFGKMEISNPK